MEISTTEHGSCVTYPIQFIEQEPIGRLPTPLVRVNCCGMMTLEVFKEVVSSDPPLGRYEIVSTQDLRGRGAVPSMMLLKLLASQPHRFATKDWLSTQMQQEMERGALVRLDTIASQLRKQFRGFQGDEASALGLVLVAYLRNGRGSGPGYQLAPYPLIWLDTDALAWNVKQAARMERFGEDALPWWERAYALASRGAYLPDDPYSEWAIDKRTEVEGALRQCVHALHRLYLAHHGTAGAQHTLLLLRSYWLNHQTDEDALRPLMELLGREERYQEAEQHYQQFLLALAELGPTKNGYLREPDPRTQDIREYLRTKQIRREQVESPTINGTAQLAMGDTRISTPDSRMFLSPTDGQNRTFSFFSQVISHDLRDVAHDLGNLQRNPPLDQSDALISSVLTEYLQHQLAKLLDTLASGSTHLSIREIVEPDGLFIPPAWNILNAQTPSVSLVDYLIACLSKQQRVLLLGDAGQGKTTILKQVFTLLAQQFLSHPSNSTLLPLYIPLREISSFSGNAVEVLWAYVQDEFPFSFAHFSSLIQNNRFIILFDGLDEIRGEVTQHTINERVTSRLFAFPAILSCRKSFYESYLSLSALQELYSSKIELRSLTLNASVMRYISIFCERKQEHSLTLRTTIMNMLQSSPRLQSLAQRPLLLTMMLDIFTDQQDTEGNDWSQAKLYQKYTEKWLKYEAAKSGSVLKWNEKLTLMREIAWAISRTHIPAMSPYSLYQNVTFTQKDLFFWLEHMIALPRQVPVFRLVDDLCFRTFFISNDGDTYAFIHKSFQEYFAARYIFEHLRGRNQTVETASSALQQILPVEVVGFLKEMLSTTEFTRYDRDGVISLLIQVYQHHTMNDRTSVTIRQNACAYLAYIGTPRAVQFLEQSYEQEPNKWVQRGMMVGLALFCRKTTILEQYVEMIQTDPEVASINLGYHLIYYGDQASEDGYYDQGGEHCAGTVRSIFRRLRNEHYHNVWALDLVTLRTLLSTRGTQILSGNEQHLSFLNQFLQGTYQDQGKTFQQEQQRLRTLLQGALL